MTAILRFKDTDGNWVHVPSLIGKAGNSITNITRVGRDGDISTGYKDTYRIDFSDNTSTTFTITNGAQGAKGDKGDKGDTLVGTVTTLNADEEATVTTTEKDGKTYLNFGIPKGNSSVIFVDYGDEE